MREITVRMEREEIDVTRNGLFGGPTDYQKKIMPGLATYYVTVDGEDLPPMGQEQFEAWRKKENEAAMGGLI